MFQLENVIGMVEGLPHQTEPHGVNAREHDSSLSPRLWVLAPPLAHGPPPGLIARTTAGRRAREESHADGHEPADTLVALASAGQVHFLDSFVIVTPFN